MTTRHGETRGELYGLPATASTGRSPSPLVGGSRLQTVLVLACLAPVCLGARAAARLPQAQVAKQPVPADTRVLVLRPLLRFEGTLNEAVIQVPQTEAQAFADALLSAARAAVGLRRLELLDVEGQPADVAASGAQLHVLSNRVAQGSINDEVNGLLARIGSADSTYAVLAFFARFKRGPGGYWDPNTGAIGSSMSTVQLYAALTSCAAGRVLWKNQILLRTNPRPGSRDFSDAAAALFKGF